MRMKWKITRACSQEHVNPLTCHMWTDTFDCRVPVPPAIQVKLQQKSVIKTHSHSETQTEEPKLTIIIIKQKAFISHDKFCQEPFHSGEGLKGRAHHVNGDRK